MIVDLHTHFLDDAQHLTPRMRDDLARCGMDPHAYRFTEEEYLEGTRAADRAVVFGIRGGKTGWQVENGFVSSFVKRNPKYIYFASIDPTENDYMDQLAYEHEVNHCKGVKLGPVYQGVHPLAPEYYRIFAYCQRHRLPIITHMATTFSSGVPLEYARPVHMDQAVCDFPELKIVIAHLGHPWIEECVAAIRHQPNLYADLSALYYRPYQFYQAMTLVKEYGVSGKVFFGSDFPATTTAGSIQGIRRMNDLVQGTAFPRFPEELLEEIINRDSLSILEIEG